ncbi:hypothetical protein NEICINOT_05172 [Neisseria cinerea ATCC 14685]|uniref:Uncharacterized protein n=1 Tax=Neisseria cinerea ATCC 14685 TaxID=546262 RepID=D0W644_NEICI|nr:hypothetical protein NEICINOT_05172 [Neisseria cinerea ATCC 14685]
MIAVKDNERNNENFMYSRRWRQTAQICRQVKEGYFQMKKHIGNGIEY